MKIYYKFLFFPSLLPINAYIYEKESSLTLIDIGMTSMCTPILAIVKKLGKPIEHIIITHAHNDHVSGLDSIKKEFPNAKVCISERDSKLLKGDFSLSPEEEQAAIKGRPCKVKTMPDRLLHEGENIGSLKVILTPGHTPGSISLLDPKGILIAGDCFQTKGGVAVSGDLRLMFPFPALGTWSKKTALKSAQKIAKEDSTLLATGHGDMVQNAKAKIEQAILRMEQKSFYKE
ncbi:MBL fold metallo-hydrolase [Erwinia sp. CPCC 100877]|nr:MBL fold metallo-hydrolase [Erwinia sp. CPCC 100877]